MNIFLMCCIWIPVLVVGVSLFVNYFDMGDPVPPQLCILLLVELVVAIIATAKYLPLLPAAITNIVIMILYWLDLEVLSKFFLLFIKNVMYFLKSKWFVCIAVVILSLIGFGIRKSFVKVDPGERAIKRTFAKIEPQTYGPGLVWYIPFSKAWGNEVIKVSTRPQRFAYDNVAVRTKELQQVTLDCSILLQLTPDSIHVLYDKYTGYQAYEENVIRDMVQSTMLALASQMSFWSFAEETNNLMTDAVKYIVSDQLMAENLVRVETFRLKGFHASPEVEALIDQTAQARQGIELEKAKVEKAKVETERVKQEALQTYERMAAVAKANGIDVQIKAEALRNPFVAQYEVAKALQNWKGEVTLPSTLAIMEQASNGGGGTSIFPIVPITTGK